MSSIEYIDRATGNIKKEKVFGERAISLLYGEEWYHRFMQTVVCKNSFFSFSFGLWQKMPWTRFHISSFVKKYQINPEEFEKQIHDFTSFNDFFIRKLKPRARPLSDGEDIACIPADGRYQFFQDISIKNPISIKKESISLEELVDDRDLARKYSQGSMVVARLSPVDCHRFYYPCSGVPGISKLVNGYLYSVNPLAMKENFRILTQNKRMIANFVTEHFGSVIMIEIGATNVGSIRQTYIAGRPVDKGAEKGYFSFGGSALILLFPPNSIAFDEDLLVASNKGKEIYCQIGQSMGRSLSFS